MGFFKSKQEREMERKLAVKKARMSLEKHIGSCKKDAESYIRIAREARAIGNAKQVEIARRAVNKSLRQQRIAETQLINIKLAEQMQNQVSSHKHFADAMRAVIKSASEGFKQVKMDGLEKGLAQTSARADMLNERMEMFLETSADAIIGESFEEEFEDGALGQDEFDMLLAEAGAAEISGDMDDKIRAKLDEVEKTLKK